LHNLAQLLELWVRAQEIEVAHITSSSCSTKVGTTTGSCATALTTSSLGGEIEKVHVVIALACFRLGSQILGWGSRS
jgi:hypothetical protein